jgi:hypothetical protein
MINGKIVPTRSVSPGLAREPTPTCGIWKSWPLKSNRDPLCMGKLGSRLQREVWLKMTAAEDKVAQCTAWLQEWVKPLIDPITVNEHPSEMFEWKIYRGEPPALLDVLRMKPTTFASPDERFRRRSLWTQLRNILDLHGVDTTAMGTAYPE